MKFNGCEVLPLGGNTITPNLREVFLARAGDMIDSDHGLNYVFQTDTYITMRPELTNGFTIHGYPMPRYCEEGNGP
jgi:hypothetical protein